MSTWEGRYRARIVTAAEAIRSVRCGARVFVGSGCAEPVGLVEALAARDDVADVEVLHIMTVGHAPYAQAAHAARDPASPAASDPFQGGARMIDNRKADRRTR